MVREQLALGSDVTRSGHCTYGDCSDETGSSLAAVVGRAVFCVCMLVSGQADTENVAAPNGPHHTFHKDAPVAFFDTEISHIHLGFLCFCLLFRLPTQKSNSSAEQSPPLHPECDQQTRAEQQQG
jgi:hypothetical protein